MQVQQFLKGHIMLGQELCESMVRLEHFGLIMHGAGFEAALTQLLGSASTESGDALLHNIAVHISANTDGVEGDLLRKSLHETFYQIAGPVPELSRATLGNRLLSFLRRRGTAGLLRSFLFLHVFNIVWFQTSDDFRALASTPDSFVDQMHDLER